MQLCKQIWVASVPAAQQHDEQLLQQFIRDMSILRDQYSAMCRRRVRLLLGLSRWHGEPKRYLAQAKEKEMLAYTKELRNAFKDSAAQRDFYARDCAAMPSRVAKRRTDSRYEAMLMYNFGGRRCFAHFLMTGELVDRRFSRGPGAPRAVPQGLQNPKLSKAAKRKRRESYFAKLAEELKDPTARSQLRTSKMPPIMERRARQQQSGATTHQWAQMHLRRAGVVLPPTQKELDWEKRRQQKEPQE